MSAAGFGCDSREPHPFQKSRQRVKPPCRQSDFEGIAAAIFEGYRRGCADPEKAVAAFKADFPQMDAEYIRQSWTKVCKTVGGNYGTQTKEGWQATIDMYKSLGLLKADVKPEEVMP